MFPHCLFPVAAFPNAVFPGIGIGNPPVAFATLWDAIRGLLLQEMTTLTGCYFMETPPKPTPVPPFCIGNPLNESPEWNLSGTSYAAWHTIQLTFISNTAAEGRSLRDAAYLLFAPKKNSDGTMVRPALTFDAGSAGPIPGIKTQWKQPKGGTGGVPSWLFAFDCRFYVTRML